MTSPDQEEHRHDDISKKVRKIRPARHLAFAITGGGHDALHVREKVSRAEDERPPGKTGGKAEQGKNKHANDQHPNSIFPERINENAGQMRKKALRLHLGNDKVDAHCRAFSAARAAEFSPLTAARARGDAQVAIKLVTSAASPAR